VYFSRNIAGFKRDYSGKMADAKEKEEPPRRIDLSVPASTHRYLQVLKDRGTHGSTLAGVAKTLVESGIRQAFKDGFITKLEGD
jgi:hypothetical protein